MIIMLMMMIMIMIWEEGALAVRQTRAARDVCACIGASSFDRLWRARS